jgi:hypothetical protein
MGVGRWLSANWYALVLVILLPFLIILILLGIYNDPMEDEYYE